MRRFLLVLTAIIMSVLMAGCSSRAHINDMFNAFEIETAEKIPYVHYGTLVVNDKTLNFNELLDANGYNATFHEVYVIQGNTVWFGFADAERNKNGSRTWHIASVTTDGTDLNIPFSNEFCSASGSVRTYWRNNYCSTQERYLAANGYYYDGKIILTDHVKVVEFDLATIGSKEFLAENYHFPTLPIEAEITDSQSITFYKNAESQIFDAENGKQTSKAFENLYELEKEKNWQGKSYLSGLFSNVQIVNNQVFIICSVLNWDGETHAIVFQYDFEDNSCKYAFHCFMDDVISNHLYVVPMI